MSDVHGVPDDSKAPNDRRLRIALVPPIADAIRPDTTRSIESVVWRLADGLVALGHDVTLFATADSRTRAKLESRYERGYASDRQLWDWTFHETLNVAAAIERSDSFDVIHSHAYHFAVPFVRLSRSPILHTMHTLPDADILDVLTRCRDAHISAISHYQARQLAPANPLGVIHHGIDVDALPYAEHSGSYLLFLGTVSTSKGADRAIVLARRSGLPLIIAGPPGDAIGTVELAADGQRVRYLGKVNARDRDALLAGALALLYPIARPEPFGLVLVEAMACGTPVVATDVGAVTEIIDDGVTGFLAGADAGFTDALRRVGGLSRRRIREVAKDRFGHERMTAGYLELYRRLARQDA